MRTSEEVSFDDGGLNLRRFKRLHTFVGQDKHGLS